MRDRTGRRLAAALGALVAVAAFGACGAGGSRAGSPAGSSSSAPPSTTTTVSTLNSVATPPATDATTTVAPRATSTTTPPAVGLQGAIDAYAARQAVPFGIVAVDLRSGERAERLAGRQVLSASLYKLFVARELLRQITAGALDRESQAGDGNGRTWGQCLTDMIVVSDDPCGVAGLKHVGRGALDPSLHAAGYVGTTLSSPQQTTPADVALFLIRTRDGTLLGPDGAAPTGKLWELLRRQQVRDRFPRGLPPGTPIAHKTGDRTGWAHDGGVITTPRGEVLLVAMTGPWSSPCCHAERPGPAEERAFASLAGLAGEVFGYITR